MIAVIGLILVCLVLAVCHHFYTAYEAARREKENEKLQEEQRKKYLAGAQGAFVPKPGRVMNPLKGYPRNYPCFCKSGIKAKKCCLPTLMETCDQKHYELLQSYVKEIKKVYDGKNHDHN